ncbi:MAG: TIGR04255 family protein [Mariniphaga sp.]|nr:TIGR04255 family protein [Mariniphaga sp.]
MTIKEVFPNPTVKKVIFQIKFPNLFYIEDKIGDFQIRIMDQFPKSSLVFEKQFLFALGINASLADAEQEKLKKGDRKIWQFKNDENVQVNLYADSLSITSESHKTYSNTASENRFRDIIEYVVGNLIDIVNIPVILRIGFRYLDEFPLMEKNNENYLNHFNSAFNLERFDISEAGIMEIKTNLSRGKYFFNYGEKVLKKDEQWTVFLDFDAFANNIKAEDFLTVTDELHDINVDEFKKVIKEPVYEYMRKK